MAGIEIAECAVTGWGEQEMLRGAYMAGIEIAECAVTGMGRTGDVAWSLHGGD